MNKIYTFNNGLKLINNYMPTTRAVAIGVFAGIGSAYESLQENGLSHFAEHMLFKGTTDKNAYEIAESIDSIGAQINAYTSKELTSYYTICVDTHAEYCTKVLADIYQNSLLLEEEIERESNVVLEEISMVEDTPDDLCFQLVSEAYYNDHPLAYPILGTRKRVKSFNHKILKNFIDKYYNPTNTLISIAGNLTDKQAEQLVRKYFVASFEREAIMPKKLDKALVIPRYVHRFKQMEQANTSIALNGIELGNKAEVSALLMNSLLSGGMSSLLFQNIREKLGLAYSVYGFPSSYTNNGSYIIYFGTSAENSVKAIEATKKIIATLLKDGISDSDFRKGKEQLKGALVLGQESAASVMNANGKSLMLRKTPFDIDLKLQKIDKTTKEEIMNTIEHTFDFDKASVAYVGPEIKHNLLDVLRG